jgi:hypothetical protein
MAAAGRAVVLSGLTVAIGLLALIVLINSLTTSETAASAYARKGPAHDTCQQLLARPRADRPPHADRSAHPRRQRGRSSG